MDKIKALVIGGATLDTIIEYEEMLNMDMQHKTGSKSYMLLEEGAKIEVVEQNIFTGGGATNTSFSLNKLGLDVDIFIKIADDIAGAKILKELEEQNINTDHIRYSKTYGTATSYVVPSLNGDRTIFAYRGANKDILKDDLPCESISKSEFIYITSLSKSSAARLPEIVSLAVADNTKVAINPGASQLSVGESFIKDSMFGIDILVLNYQEAKQLMMSLLSSKDSEVLASREEIKNDLLESNDSVFQEPTFNLRSFFKLCIKLGPRIIVVTDGANGIYAATKDTLYHSDALKVENIVNTLGAGDAFSSTFCASIYKGCSIEKSIAYGLLNSSNVIKYHDAKTGLQDITDLDKNSQKIESLEKEITVKSW